MAAKQRPIKTSDWKFPNPKINLPKVKIDIPKVRVPRGPTVRWSIDYDKLLRGKKK
jgi:hypothetical protein